MIQEIITTKIFIVDSITNGVPPAVQNRILYDKSDKKLKIYDNSSWQQLESDATIYAADFATLSANAGAFAGQVGIDAEKETLYFWSGSEWVAAGGSGSINIVADSAAVSALDGELGDVAISSDNNVLWYYDGTAWVSTQELINIPFVYVGAGNIAANTTSLTGKTNQQMWEALLTKEMNPTINQPSCTLTMTGATNGSYQEIGAELNLTFIATYEDGSVVNTWGSKATQSSSYAGALESITYTYPTDGDLVSSTTSPHSQTIAYTVKSGNQEWKATATYEAGIYQPVTNYGSNYGSTCAAGSKSSSAVKFTGVYPVFATTANITTATKQTLIAEPTTTSTYISINMVTEGDGSSGKQFFELPASWASITGVSDSGGSWLNGSKDNSLLQWNKSETMHDINGSTISYAKYSYTGPTAGARTIRIYLK